MYRNKCKINVNIVCFIKWRPISILVTTVVVQRRLSSCCIYLWAALILLSVIQEIIVVRIKIDLTESPKILKTLEKSSPNRIT